MRLTWLRSLTTDPGPFATVVLDATSDEPKGPQEVRLRWRTLRDDLAGHGADQATLEVLDAAVDDGTPPDGTAGRVLVAGAGGLLLDRFVDVPPSGSGTAAWADVPDLLTLVSIVPEEVTAVAAHVDETGGTVRAPGGEPERVSGGDSGPVHKASTAGPGEAAADNRVEETWKANAKAVADRVEKLSSATGAQQIVLTGTAPARARLLGELTPHTAELVYEIESSGGQGPDDLATTMLLAADAVRESRRTQTLERWETAVGRSDGFAVTGFANVLSAVRAQAVDTLVVDPGRVSGEREVWAAGRGEPSELAAERDELAALGAEAVASVPATPAVIRAVAAADGDLVLADADHDVRLEDGIGALLRFPTGPHA